MLDRNSENPSVKRVISTLPCHVAIPPNLAARFATDGIAPTLPDDRRQFPRMRCRDSSHRAGLKLQPTYPGLERGDSWSAVYISDKSRGGMQILHSEPLYPGEKLTLIFDSGSQSHLVVARCRRVGEHCYAVGTRYVET